MVTLPCSCCGGPCSIPAAPCGPACGSSKRDELSAKRAAPAAGQRPASGTSGIMRSGAAASGGTHRPGLCREAPRMPARRAGARARARAAVPVLCSARRRLGCQVCVRRPEQHLLAAQLLHQHALRALRQAGAQLLLHLRGQQRERAAGRAARALELERARRAAAAAAQAAAGTAGARIRAQGRAHLRAQLLGRRCARLPSVILVVRLHTCRTAAAAAAWVRACHLHAAPPLASRCGPP
jgi:hypothetical protein